MQQAKNTILHFLGTYSKEKLFCISPLSDHPQSGKNPRETSLSKLSPATMDNNGRMGIRNWGYYDQAMMGNLGLQLMSSVPAELNTRPFLSNGGFMHRSCGVAEPPVLPEFIPNGWFGQRDDRFLHVRPINSSYHVPPEAPAPGAHTFQMLQHPALPNEDIAEPSGGVKDMPLKKRSQTPRASNPKKPKKVSTPEDDATNSSVIRLRTGMKSTNIVINGIDLEISDIPTPVCSCTGTPQLCYRWGAGGWQSACCTTSISIYPLPMSMKRRGARISGRKMSHGAFKKVLEKIVGEGYNLSNPIDLRTHWAKHGTNKFVTIR